MKKFGFTLAEILISIAAIGIVSALTIPQLSLNVQKKVWANALATQITDFETSIKNMMIRESVIDILETNFWKKIDNEGPFSMDCPESLKNLFLSEMNIFNNFESQSFQEYYDNKIKNIENKPYTKSFDHIPFITKNNATFFIRSSKGIVSKNDFEEKAIQEGILFSVVAGNIMIDINGKKKPNTVGRDIFFFILGNNGRLYPYGGIDYYLYSKIRNVVTKYYWKNDCSDEQKVSDGIYCTGRLVENNFVMDY